MFIPYKNCTWLPAQRAFITALLFATLTGSPAIAENLANAFFAMDTGTQDAAHTNIESQVKMVKALGFSGFGPIYKNPPTLRETLTKLDQHNLTLSALYIRLDIASDKITFTPQHYEILEMLKGRGTILWIAIANSQTIPLSQANDTQIVAALKKFSNRAARANLRIALYPHTGFWIERTEDAVQLAQKVNQANLGVTFNLCHWLQVDGKNLDATLEAARNHLFLVTINGADKDAKDWDHLIQPLDKGDYDVSLLLHRLAELKYPGPIGLQHYGIKGSAEHNLARSMHAWKKLSANPSAPTSHSK